MNGDSWQLKKGYLLERKKNEKNKEIDVEKIDNKRKKKKKEKKRKSNLIKAHNELQQNTKPSRIKHITRHILWLK